MRVYKLTSKKKVEGQFPEFSVKSVIVLTDSIDEGIELARKKDEDAFKDEEDIEVSFLGESTPTVINVEYH